MSLSEIRAIIDNVDVKETTSVRIKINDAGLFRMREIDSFDFLNGELVFNVKN